MKRIVNEAHLADEEVVTSRVDLILVDVGELEASVIATG